MELNFKNIESIVFESSDLRDKLVNHKMLFNTWNVGKVHPSLRNYSQKACFDLINKLDESDIKILEDHFQEKIYIKKINYKSIINDVLDKDKLEQYLNNDSFIQKNISLHRVGNEIKVTLW